MNVLVINAGSSSLKYQLMDPETGAVSAKGLCERIYIDGRLTHKVGDRKVVKEIPMPTHHCRRTGYFAGSRGRRDQVRR